MKKNKKEKLNIISSDTFIVYITIILVLFQLALIIYNVWQIV